MEGPRSSPVAIRRKRRADGHAQGVHQQSTSRQSSGQGDREASRHRQQLSCAQRGPRPSTPDGQRNQPETAAGLGHQQAICQAAQRMGAGSPCSILLPGARVVQVDGNVADRRGPRALRGNIFADAAAEVQQAIKAAEMVDPRPLTDFMEYLASVAAPRTATGPDIQALWAKSPMHAAAGRQHRPSQSALAACNLVPPGLGPTAHMAAAQEAQHPWMPSSWSSSTENSGWQ